MQEPKIDMEQLLDHVLNDKPISIARMHEWLKHLVGERTVLMQENERLKEIDERECLIAISIKKENIKLKADKATLLKFAEWATVADLIAVTRHKARECLKQIGDDADTSQ